MQAKESLLPIKGNLSISRQRFESNVFVVHEIFVEAHQIKENISRIMSPEQKNSSHSVKNSQAEHYSRCR